MRILKYMTRYFTNIEIILWISSVSAILISSLLTGSSNLITLLASLIGVTSLIFIAKGNPVGQVLMVVFSLIYGFISWNYEYYGEMLTYVGMSMPMALLALFSWINNPYEGNKSEVKISGIEKKEWLLLLILTVLVTILFYLMLSYLDTPNLMLSTLSVATSFVAVYLTYRRSPLYALAYALNDIVLIGLWILAAFENIEYLAVGVCFLVFLINDFYGYVNWKKMKVRQSETK